jgi:hypothetical protein
MAATVTLSLISHTNVGKTTLARTLLRRDVGEVLDQEHVTDSSEAYTLIETPGAVLKLWDTPGFGDTARLMRRLRHERDPLGWFLHQVWDRVVNRPMWCSQEAVRNVRNEADLVLYLVNASENPEEAGYVPMELEILTWMKRPVLLLLNQVGAGEEDAVRRWRRFADSRDVVDDVLPLDAFTRCWTEEGILLRRVAESLEGPKREVMQAICGAWNERNLAVFRSCCEWMADYLCRAALDREAPARGGASEGDERGALELLKGAVKFSVVEKRRAMTVLGERLERSTRELMARMIEVHGLSGASAATLERRIHDFEIRGGKLPLDERSGALLGGALSGALGGLAADAVSGGLTLGGGMIAGGILGALGGAMLGRGFRLIRGDREPAVSWSPAFLERLCRQTLLRYLAVAHFGRGRGTYRDLDQPERWSEDVEETLRGHQASLRVLWQRAEQDGPGARDEIHAGLTRVLESCARDVLVRAFPLARDLLG